MKNSVAWGIGVTLLITACIPEKRESDFLSPALIAERVIDQPLSTIVPSIWMFKADGTERSFGTGPEKWVAQGNWELKGDALCWGGLVVEPSGKAFKYGPRCSRIKETSDGFAFSKSANSTELHSWGVKKISSFEPAPVAR